MTLRKYLPLAALAPALAVALAGCGRSEKDQTAAAYCPQPLTVQDASRITRFKEGAGRDPRDIMFEASMMGAMTACKLSRNRLEVDVVMRIAVNAGPSVGAGVTRVPFFVRVLDGSGNVVQGTDELADYKLSSASPRGVTDETVAVTLPFTEIREVGAYRIAVGLKPSQQELDFNRRGESR